MSPARYGVDLDHLRRADALGDWSWGRGPSRGREACCLGMKVSARVSKMRTLPEGVDQRSTIRHPDFLGADDLAVKIEELRIATNYQVPIFIKMGATRPRFRRGCCRQGWGGRDRPRRRRRGHGCLA